MRGFVDVLGVETPGYPDGVPEGTGHRYILLPLRIGGDGNK